MGPMRGPSRWILDLSINRKLTLVTGLMALLLAGALGGLWFGMNTLSSLRAFVGGEGLWSKAQKDAFYSLRKYAYSHDESDYQNFQNLLRVQRGDRKARLAMSQRNPDQPRAVEGFLEGRNHPDDIPGMIALFTRYHRLPHIRKAIEIWTSADAQVMDRHSAGVRSSQFAVRSSQFAVRSSVRASLR
jgi:hypothetical protein